MTVLRQKMINGMKLRNFSPRTQQAYLKSVEKLSIYYKKSPDTLSSEQVQKFILHLIVEKKLSWSSCNVCFSAFKFLYFQILQFDQMKLSLPKRKKESKLPEIYSKEEIELLLKSTKILRNQLLLKTAYASGLRVGELVSLKIRDIDSKRMMIRVEQGKGKKDRYTILSERLLDDLRLYWKVYRPVYWLFPQMCGRKHITTDLPQKVYYKAVERSGIKRKGGIHSLRHSFATHLLESGINIKLIQMLLGHRSIKTTMRYLHLTQKNITSVQSPLDSLNDIDFPQDTSLEHK